MTNLDKNTRTLVICFTIAVMGLVPLRFVEVGNEMSLGASVLGERMEEVVLPEAGEPAESEAEKGLLESPYEEIEQGQVRCTTDEDIQSLAKELEWRISSGTSSEEELNFVQVELQKAEENRCN